MRFFLITVFFSASIFTHAQFTEVFWERRVITDSLGTNITSGIGQYKKLPNDSFSLGLMDDLVLWDERYFRVGEGKDVSIDSPDAIFDEIIEVKTDSAGKYRLETFITISGTIKRQLFDLSMKAVIHNHVVESRLKRMPDDPTQFDMQDYYERMMKLDSSAYKRAFSQEVKPVKYRFSHPDGSKKETAFYQLNFRWSNDLYTVFVPF